MSTLLLVLSSHETGFPPMVYLSAHRAGVTESRLPASSLQAVIHAVSLGVDYVQIDIQRTLDGKFVLSPDNTVLTNTAVFNISEHTLEDLDEAGVYLHTYTEALNAMWGRTSAQISLGFTSPDELQSQDSWEVLAARMAVDILGPDNFFITTESDASVSRLRTWSKERHPGLKVGLQLGNDQRIGLTGATLRDRLLGCDANLVVADVRQARWGLRRTVQKLELPLLVSGVDDYDEQDYWLKKSRCWAIASDYPRAAKARRSSLAEADFYA